jgi:phage shock protein C
METKSKHNAKTSTKKKQTSEKLYQKRLARNKKNKVLAGVCAGLAEYFTIDPVLIRIGFIILTLFGGSGVLLYLLLWIFIPQEEHIHLSTDSYMKANAEDIKNEATKFAADLQGGKKDKSVLAGLLIIGGVWMLLANYGFVNVLSVLRLWPTLLIGLGLYYLFRK